MQPRRHSLIGPLILITLGFMLLLANLGYLPQSFWELAFRFWPLILILIGLEIIFGRRSAFAALAIVAVWVLVIAGILFLATSPSATLPGGATLTDTISQPLGDAKSAVVKIDLGVAETTIKALGADSADLVAGTYAHSQGMQIIKKHQVAGTEAKLNLEEEGNTFFGNLRSQLDLALNAQILLKLEIDGGVGRATLDFSSLNLTSANIDVGVGALQITTPKTGTTSLRVSGGVGDVAIIIPAGVAARIRVNTGIGGTNVDTTRFPKSDGLYQSVDFASAANRIEIDVNGGVGAISIR